MEHGIKDPAGSLEKTKIIQRAVIHVRSALVFGIIVGTVILLGTISLAEAHPHASITLMESHPPNVNDEDFNLHTFEGVVITTFNFVTNILFS